MKIPAGKPRKGTSRNVRPVRKHTDRKRVALQDWTLEDLEAAGIRSMRDLTCWLDERIIDG